MVQPHYQDDLVTLHHGDCLDVLRSLPDASVDAVVTDPPYGLEFMGKDWDAPWKASSVGRGARVAQERSSELTERGKGHSTSGGAYLAAGVDSIRVAGLPFQKWCTEWATECLRVLKPGGYMVAFGGSRTWHRLASAVEDAGFEIRDSIAWLYGSGFPKSRNLDGDRQGWGTALKPAFEPIVVGRKPLAGTVAANVLAYGTGAINIDACRIATDDVLTGSGTPPLQYGGDNARPFHATAEPRGVNQNAAGRWPTNVVLDGPQAAELDKQTGILTSGKMAAGTRRAPRDGAVYGRLEGDETPRDTPGDSGGASRYFPTFHYEAKAPTHERPNVDGIAHPTVKPLDLMRWLVRLVTPPGGVVLEPFAGSGTTAEACVIEGFACIAIEREATYLPLIIDRLTKPIDVVLDLGNVA